MSISRRTADSSDPLDTLITGGPYAFDPEEKQRLLLAAMQEAYKHHFQGCPAFRRYCERRGLGAETSFSRFEDIPYLPVQAFKDHADLLLSVEPSQAKIRLQSSATSGVPSTVLVDKTTSKRQIRALTAVLSAVLGPRRRPFLIMDGDPRAGGGGALGARMAAVRGFLTMARQSRYCMKAKLGGLLELDMEAWKEALEELESAGEPVVVFGFTYILYCYAIEALYEAGTRFKLPAGSHVMHIGGWKKLEDRKVDKATFNRQVSEVLGVEPSHVVDLYGFTEQMGITYPDGPDGHKHAPAFAEVVVRDPDSHDPLPDGEVGLLEFITPIPWSYPGVAVMTDDLGVIVGRGRDEHGWSGTRFDVVGRAKKAEARGCGDIMADKVVRQTRPGDRVSLEPTRIRLLADGSGPLVPPRLESQVRLASLPEVEDVAEVAERLRAARTKLDGYSVDELIALVGAAAQRWLRDDSPIAALRQQGLLFLSNWCQPRSLRAVADASLRGHRGYLDAFVPVGGTNRRLLRAQPRGLVCHWLAGNVPLLGMLTLAQSIVTRNANLLKAASTFSNVMPLLLESFRGLEITTHGGKVLRGDDILDTIAVVYFPSSHHEAGEAMSAAADVRLAWGGKEAVEAIVNQPKRHATEDIVFGPKLSYMAICREHMSSERHVRRLARRAATDVSVFDQYACASPHTIFVERGGTVASPRDFAELVARELSRATVRIPKQPVDAGTAGAIFRARMRYEFTADLWTSSGTEWSVLYDEEGESGLAEPTYSRVITVRAIDDIVDAAEFAHGGIQTVGLAVDGPRKLEFAHRATALGAERLPEIGRMTFFDTPWDGLYAMDRFVRWVSVGGPW